MIKKNKILWLNLCYHISQWSSKQLKQWNINHSQLKLLLKSIIKPLLAIKLNKWLTHTNFIQLYITCSNLKKEYKRWRHYSY